MPPRLFSILFLTGNSTDLQVNVFLSPFGNPAAAVCFVAEGTIRASAQTRVGAAFFALFWAVSQVSQFARFQPF
jgi:hypothetical protein